MRRWFASRLSVLLVATAVVATGATALASGPGASATNRNWSSTNRSFCNGPDDYYGTLQGTNYSYQGVNIAAWRYSNGSYTMVAQGASAGYTVTLGHLCTTYGHGEVLTYNGGNATLAGHMDNYGC